MSEEHSGKRRPFFFPFRGGLSEPTLEKIRGRHLRSRLQNLSRLGRPLKMLLFIGAMAGLSYLAISQLKHLFFSTSYFELRKIEVSGLMAINREDLLRLAQVAPGMNVITLDRDGIRRRLVTHPFVKDVSVSLDGLYTLSLAIRERAPLFYIKVGTAFIEVSEDGVVLSAEGLGELGLPIITGLPLKGWRVGDSLANHDGFLEARNWVTGLGPDVLSQISEVNFASLQNPYVYLVSGQKIFPRSLEDFRDRFVFLRALLDNLQKNNVEPEYLDMRAPNEIVVKPRRPMRPMEGGSKPLAGG